MILSSASLVIILFAIAPSSVSSSVSALYKPSVFSRTIIISKLSNKALVPG